MHATFDNVDSIFLWTCLIFVSSVVGGPCTDLRVLRGWYHREGHLLPTQQGAQGGREETVPGH